ncbi:YggS family pyridoxal phosphate-dependent enzyme [Aquimarina agarilytica]|uniref:YggS family pyridoxal phosphate-dependent enzyme n=1 Tax=Aquimarina agarilytica TaxID=1087449 RepID=UPI000287A59C|nr:YggS family pyridoxal phosphate-dependent enzyme [Aquimarina agarilytica]
MSTQISKNITELKQQLPEQVSLVAVSKTKPIEDLQEAYNAGQRIFGENKIQEMAQKWEALPKDIEWHMIGHVQTNKVKYMAPFVHLIHAVDSFKLLKEINKQALKNNRIIHCLLQLKIAEEDSKFGLSLEALTDILNHQELSEFNNIVITGFMGMASFTSDESQLKEEFNYLKTQFDTLKQQKQTPNIQLKTLSMGMSGDYPIAISCGSTMVRVGSAIFGARNYKN